jgi:hypothetical protein
MCKALKINTWRTDNTVNKTHFNAVISHLPSQIAASGIENFGLLEFFGKLS